MVTLIKDCGWGLSTAALLWAVVPAIRFKSSLSALGGFAVGFSLLSGSRSSPVILFKLFTIVPSKRARRYCLCG